MPAKVVTFPAGSIFRITKLPVSATKRLPPPSIVMLEGELNQALVPLPSR